jgi:hypothetical protein
MKSTSKRIIGRRAVRDKDYLKWVHDLPCIVCQLHKLKQESRTEAAHVGVRGLGQKCSDREAIPLCGTGHHREGKYSQHRMGIGFWNHWGLDRRFLIERFNRIYDEMMEAKR